LCPPCSAFHFTVYAGCQMRLNISPLGGLLSLLSSNLQPTGAPLPLQYADGFEVRWHHEFAVKIVALLGVQENFSTERIKRFSGRSRSYLSVLYIKDRPDYIKDRPDAIYSLFGRILADCAGEASRLRQLSGDKVQWTILADLMCSDGSVQRRRFMTKTAHKLFDLS